MLVGLGGAHVSFRILSPCVSVGWGAPRVRSVCNYPYDLAAHEPMSLSCGHSVCRSCWEEWVGRKGAVCPSDRQVIKSTNRTRLALISRLPERSSI